MVRGLGRALGRAAPLAPAWPACDNLPQPPLVEEGVRDGLAPEDTEAALSDWQSIVRSEVHPMVPYSPGLRASEVRASSGKDRVIKLSSNEHPAGPVPKAMRAMSEVLPRLNRYPDGSARALRSRLAKRLGVSFDQVTVGSGSNEIINLIGQAVLRPGDEVVFGWPSFVVYPMISALMGATAVRVPLEDDTYDLDAMLDAVTERTRIVFLCNPNNPTGSIYRRPELERFLGAIPEGVLVVSDEAYFEFVTDTEFPDGLSYFDGERPFCVLRTFSKAYSLAGLRVGYGIVPERLREALDKVRAPFNVNSVAQVAAYYSLDDDAEVRRRRAENQELKEYLYACFDRLGVAFVPSEANFVYMKTERPLEAFEALLAQGVIVRAFGETPALRITIPAAEDCDAVIEAIEAAHEALGGF